MSRDELFDMMQQPDDPQALSIMYLPYKDGDTAYFYDFTTERAFKGKVVQLALPKKMEWRAILITIEDEKGNTLRRSIDKTIMVDISAQVLKVRIEQYYRQKALKARNMDLDKQPTEFNDILS